MRYRIFLLVAALWGQSGCSDDALRSLDCVTGDIVLCKNKGDIAFDGIGVCSSSKKKCEVGVWSECSLEITPTDEICDNLDNNCDGSADETDPTDLRCLSEKSDRVIFYDDKDNDTYGDSKTAKCLCETRIPEYFDVLVKRGGDCNDFFETINPSIIEICDNVDNDCNELIDDLSYMTSDTSKWEKCYDGDEELLWNGACKEGHKECFSGKEFCMNQILPSQEICDFVDNDCNGIINDGLDNTNRAYDIVLVIDKSGSMQASIDINKAAARSWARSFPQEEYKFALVAVAETSVPTIISDKCLQDCVQRTCNCAQNDTSCQDGCRNSCTIVCDTDIALLTNFTDSMTFSNILGQQDADGSGSENTYDVLKYIADGKLQLSWRQNAIKIVVMFTDEEAQSVEDNTESEIESFCVNNNLITYFFIKHQYVFYFDDIAYGSGGNVYNVDDWENEILENLNEIIAGACDIQLP